MKKTISPSEDVKELGKLADGLTRAIGSRKSVFTAEEKKRLKQIRDELNEMLAKKLRR